MVDNYLELRQKTREEYSGLINKHLIALSRKNCWQGEIEFKELWMLRELLWMLLGK